MFEIAREKFVDNFFEAKEWLRELVNELLFDLGNDSCRAIIQMHEESPSGNKIKFHVSFPNNQRNWGPHSERILEEVHALPDVRSAEIDEDSLSIELTHRKHALKVKRHLVRTLRREYTWWLRPIQQFIKYDRKRYAAA